MIAGKRVDLGTLEDVARAATAYDWDCINQGVRFDLASEIPLQCCPLKYQVEMTRINAAQAPTWLTCTRWDIRCFVWACHPALPTDVSDDICTSTALVSV